MSRLFYGLEDGIEHWITNRIEAHIFWCLDTTGRGLYTCWTSISQEMGFPTTNTGRVVIGCPNRWGTHPIVPMWYILTVISANQAGFKAEGSYKL